MTPKTQASSVQSGSGTCWPPMALSSTPTNWKSCWPLLMAMLMERSVIRTLSTWWDDLTFCNSVLSIKMVMWENPTTSAVSEILCLAPICVDMSTWVTAMWLIDWIFAFWSAERLYLIKCLVSVKDSILMTSRGRHTFSLNCDDIKASTNPKAKEYLIRQSKTYVASSRVQL